MQTTYTLKISSSDCTFPVILDLTIQWKCCHSKRTVSQSKGYSSFPKHEWVMQTAINVGWLLLVQNWMPGQDQWLNAHRECYEIIDLLLNSIILKLTLSSRNTSLFTKYQLIQRSRIYSEICCMSNYLPKCFNPPTNYWEKACMT